MANSWPRGLVAISLGLLWTLLTLVAVASVNKQLPDCHSHMGQETPAVLRLEKRENRNLLIVSTLDGRVSALDASDGGRLVWSHSTGPGSLLSSSISNLEVPSQGGRWARIIPSLDGNLYKFDGEAVEPIPLNADVLLQSSYMLSDDTVITGGKEKRTYGISLQSGELVYACSASGCTKTNTRSSKSDDIIIVQRQTRTIRGIEPRSGEERWNFSVGENQVSLLMHMSEGCSSMKSEPMYEVADVETWASDEDVEVGEKAVWDRADVKVGVPEGVITLQNSVTGSHMWSYQFESPVTHAWYVKDGLLMAIDLLDPGKLLSFSGDTFTSAPPVMYIGVHDKQLYIQHSSSVKNRILSAANQFALTPHATIPRLEWKPYVATASSRTPTINTGQKIPSALDLFQQKTTALTLSYGSFDYPYDQGYFLYEVIEVSVIHNQSECLPEDAESEEEESLNQIIIVSLWHWWKEVLAISIASSVLVNLLITRYFLRKMRHRLLQENSNSLNQQSSSDSSDKTEVCTMSPSPKDASLPECAPAPYVSRYLTDFEPLQLLGKGGFGVVFEARNRIDDCCYAIKRIYLPNSKEAREKMLREVKALAKLDHAGIVRYFNAWLEWPPPGWQEEWDRQWNDSERMTPTPCQTNIPGTPTDVIPLYANPLKPFDEMDEASFGFSVEKNADKESGSFSFEEDKLLKHPSAACSKDSFEIVFAESTGAGGDMPVPFSDCCKVAQPDSDVSELGAYSLNFKRYKTAWSSVSTTSQSLVQAKDSGCADPSMKSEANDSAANSNLPENRPNRPDKLDIAGSQMSVDKHAPKVYLYIQMQLCRKDSLKDWLNLNTEREKLVVLDIFEQIVSAVQYVHDCSLMHRDLKPSNIFFSLDGTVKVGDFGLVTAVTEQEVHTPDRGTINYDGRYTDQVGTQLYMSPEQIAGLPYSHKIDIFSLGLIFFELLVPFRTQMERIKILTQVKGEHFPEIFRRDYPEECALVKQLMSRNPEARPEASKIKQHTLFKAFQPQPEVLARARRRRTLSARIDSSGSEGDSCQQNR